MWRGKKFLVVTVLAAVLLAGGIGGVALAQEEGDDAQPESQCGNLLERVCEIYEENTGAAIDAEALKDAFAQARSEIQAERPERFRLSICGPMFGRTGIHGNLLEELGINIDDLEGLKEEIQAVRDEVRSDIESGVLTPDEARTVIKDKTLEVLENYGIDTEALEAARSEALEARKGECAEILCGEGSFGHRFIFRSRGGHCGFGRLFAPHNN